MNNVTVLVLDRSGSMGEEIMGLDGRKAPKIGVVKEALRSLIAYKIRFFPQDLIGAIAFGITRWRSHLAEKSRTRHQRSI